MAVRSASRSRDGWLLGCLLVLYIKGARGFYPPSLAKTALFGRDRFYTGPVVYHTAGGCPRKYTVEVEVNTTVCIFFNVLQIKKRSTRGKSVGVIVISL